MQRRVLWIGIVLFALALLFPPWHRTTLAGGGIDYTDAFRFLFQPDNNGLVIDDGAWATLLAGIATLTFAIRRAIKPL